MKNPRQLTEKEKSFVYSTVLYPLTLGGAHGRWQMVEFAPRKDHIDSQESEERLDPNSGFITAFSQELPSEGSLEGPELSPPGATS